MDKPKALFPTAAPTAVPDSAPSPKTSAPAPAPVSHVKTLFAEMPKAAPPTVGKPTEVLFPGMFVRKRPDVQIGVLRTFNLDVAEDSVFQAAVDEITHSDPDAFTVETVLDFGVPEQREFALASERMLQLSLDPVLTSVLEKCKSIAADVKKTEAGSGFSRFIETMTEGESDEIRMRRITAMASAVEAQISQLPLLRGKADVLSQDLEGSLRKIQKRLVVGRWFASVLDKKEISTVLDGRLQSLSITRLSLLQAKQQVKVLDDRVVHLITVVNSSLVTLIPAWHGRCVAANENKRNPSPTDLKSKILEVLDAVK